MMVMFGLLPSTICVSHAFPSNAGPSPSLYKCTQIFRRKICNTYVTTKLYAQHYSDYTIYVISTLTST